jgi:Bacterial Ig-like domain (group 3)
MLPRNPQTDESHPSPTGKPFGRGAGTRSKARAALPATRLNRNRGIPRAARIQYPYTPFRLLRTLRLGLTRGFALQSVSRSILSSLFSVAAAVFTLVPAAFGQSQVAVATSTALTAAPARDASGKIVFTVHVSRADHAAGAGSGENGDRGSVTVEETGSDGQPHSLGSAFIDAEGNATLTVPALAEGTHSVRAVYSGTESLASSASEAAGVTSEAAAPDFSLSAAPATLNLTAGAQGSVAITITPGAGFSNYVALSCAGLPLFTTCNFLPSNVSVTGATAGSTMTLNTTAPSGQTGLLHRDTGMVYAFLLPGVLGLVGLALGRNRTLRVLAIFCVVGSLIGGASSCAQRYRYLNFGPGPNLGTPAGQSIIRVYGTAVNGALSTSKCFQVTLNVTSTNTSGTSGNSLIPCS